MMTWEEALKELDSNILAPSVHLICDGINVSFANRLNGRKSVIMWFVDGSWKEEYTFTTSDVGAKFGHPRYSKPNKKAVDVRKLFTRLNGKRFDPKTFIKENTKVILYSPFHPSAASVIRTLKRTCTNIQLKSE